MPSAWAFAMTSFGDAFGNLRTKSALLVVGDVGAALFLPAEDFCAAPVFVLRFAFDWRRAPWTGPAVTVTPGAFALSTTPSAESSADCERLSDLFGFAVLVFSAAIDAEFSHGTAVVGNEVAARHLHVPHKAVIRLAQRAAARIVVWAMTRLVLVRESRPEEDRVIAEHFFRMWRDNGILLLAKTQRP